MTNVDQLISDDAVLAELRGLSQSRFFTKEAKAILSRAVSIVERQVALPAQEVRRHVVRRSYYTIQDRGVEIQAHRPIQEGDTITVYVDHAGKKWGRLDDEFDQRFEKVDPFKA